MPLHINDLPDRIQDETDIDRCAEVLSSLDPVIAMEISNLDIIPLRLRAPGFEGLVEIIVGQQISKASASAMLGRLRTEFASLTAQSCQQAGEEPLIRAGLSRAKQAAVLGLADAVVDERLNLSELSQKPVDLAMTELTALKGIGPWTAEVFLLFCAGHRDVFPAGDVALQQAIMDIGLHPSRPSENKAREIASRWQPVRGVAARVLWAVYAKRRQRGELPV